ncbi:hypothetical protein [Bartonella tribocorum]|uniref:Uncharacterized protein n=1 Tax=Bartonella tribocorum TaxID=85701 RepID=A0A2N9Y874_9HYPH|nr:hypothetical protein [Bartonella tribocorum]PIT67907.1 hypothetical protein CEV08_09025 [Bartonella tribocorum]
MFSVFLAWFDGRAMLSDGVLLPSLALLGIVSLSLTVIYISARIAMKRFRFTKKVFFRNMVFCFSVGLASQWGYGTARAFGIWLALVLE